MLNGARLQLEEDPPRVVDQKRRQHHGAAGAVAPGALSDPNHLDPHTQQRLFDPHRLPDDSLSFASSRAAKARRGSRSATGTPVNMS